MESKRIVVVGPESTGKSELAEFLANHYQTVWVPEYARTYLENLNRPYSIHDLTAIADGQQALEDSIKSKANNLLICDTDLLVIKVWSEFKYGNCDPAIISSLENSQRDLYLLTYIDLPWEDDPQREHPHNREELFEIYTREINASEVPFVEIRGERAERHSRAIKAIDRLLTSA